jgi:hypothetical protein
MLKGCFLFLTTWLMFWIFFYRYLNWLARYFGLDWCICWMARRLLFRNSFSKIRYCYYISLFWNKMLPLSPFYCMVIVCLVLLYNLWLSSLYYYVIITCLLYIISDFFFALLPNIHTHTHTQISYHTNTEKISTSQHQPMKIACVKSLSHSISQWECAKCRCVKGYFFFQMMIWCILWDVYSKDKNIFWHPSK